MTITETTTESPVVFDFDGHAERGTLLRAELVAAREELVSAEADREVAEEAIELLDVLSDTDSKITKARLAAERAEARVNRAAAAQRSAQRKVDGHNVDVRLAEAVRPMMSKLTGDHPSVAIHALPAEPDWSALSVPALVAIQQTEAVADEWNPGRLSTAAADQRNAVRLSYLHDQYLHRDLLSDRESVITAAARSGVDLRSTDRPEAAVQGVALNNLRPRTRELGSGLAVTELALHVAAYPEVPALAVEDFDPTRFVAAVTRRAERIAPKAKLGEPRVRTDHRDGQRVASILVPITVRQGGAELADDLRKWLGHAHPGTGRVVDVRLSELGAEFVAVSLPE